MMKFNTIGDQKIWAIETAFNRFGIYPNIIYTASTINPINATVYLSNKFKSYVYIPKNKSFPKIIGFTLGLRLVIGEGNETKFLTITWGELLLYCRKRFKELGYK